MKKNLLLFLFSIILMFFTTNVNAQVYIYGDDTTKGICPSSINERNYSDKNNLSSNDIWYNYIYANNPVVIAERGKTLNQIQKDIYLSLADGKLDNIPAIYIMGGMQDLLDNVSLESFKQTLIYFSKTVNLLDKKGITVYFVLPPYTENDTISNNIKSDVNKYYIATLEKLDKESDNFILLKLNTYNLFNTTIKGQYYCGDNLHLNAEGQKILGKLVCDKNPDTKIDSNGDCVSIYTVSDTRLSKMTQTECDKNDNLFWYVKDGEAISNGRCLNIPINASKNDFIEALKGNYWSCNEGYVEAKTKGIDYCKKIEEEIDIKKELKEPFFNSNTYRTRIINSLMVYMDAINNIHSDKYKYLLPKDLQGKRKELRIDFFKTHSGTTLKSSKIPTVMFREFKEKRDKLNSITEMKKYYDYIERILRANISKITNFRKTKLKKPLEEYETCQKLEIWSDEYNKKDCLSKGNKIRYLMYNALDTGMNTELNKNNSILDMIKKSHDDFDEKVKIYYK